MVDRRSLVVNIPDTWLVDIPFINYKPVNIMRSHEYIICIATHGIKPAPPTCALSVVRHQAVPIFARTCESDVLVDANLLTVMFWVRMVTLINRC